MTTEAEQRDQILEDADTLIGTARDLAGDDDSKKRARELGASLLLAAISLARLTEMPLEQLLEGFTKLAAKTYGFDVQVEVQDVVVNPIHGVSSSDLKQRH